MCRKNGDQIVLIVDTNKHVLDGELCQRLASPEYGLWEVVYSLTPGAGPNIWLCGTDPIDKIWVSDDIEVVRAA